MKTIVLVFLIVWLPDSEVPKVQFAPVTDSLAVCEKYAAEGAAKMRAEGKVVQAFCKEINAPGIPS